MTQYDDRITTQYPRGQHIALTCEDHPDLRWSTKNISHIGARSIFFDLGGTGQTPECSCSLRKLKPVYNPALPDFVPE